MNTFFVVSLFVTGALGTSIGWFLSAVLLSRSIRDDIAGLEAERYALDEEREMLTKFWAMDVQPPHVEWDLGTQRRTKLERVS